MRRCSTAITHRKQLSGTVRDKYQSVAFIITDHVLNGPNRNATVPYDNPNTMASAISIQIITKNGTCDNLRNEQSEPRCFFFGMPVTS